MAIPQMITAYIGDQKVLVPKGTPVPGASLYAPKTLKTTTGPMIDAYIGGVKIKVPKGEYVKGATVDQKGTTVLPVPDTGLQDIIKKYNLDPAQQNFIQYYADTYDTSKNVHMKTNEEVAKDLIDVATQAETDVGTSYNKIKSQELEKIKTQMGDIRSAAARYTQEEQLNYKQKLRNAKESLASRGRGFSGTARTELGNASLIEGGASNVEGEIPQARRYAAENSLDKIAAASRDIGRAAEQKYGSSELGKIQGEFGTFTAPYDLAAGNVNYQAGRSSPLYSVSKRNAGNPDPNYIRSGSELDFAQGTANPRYAASFDVSKENAIKRETAARMKALGYTNYK